MEEIYKINNNIYLIDTLGLGYKRTIACYLIKSSKIALIDTGYASSYKNVIKSIKKAGINLDEINYIIPTHVHLDHSGATGHLLKNMKNAKVVAHEKAFKHLVNPSKLIESAKSIFGEKMLEKFGFPISINEEKIEVVKDEMEINLGNLTLICIHSPGHAPHQISVFIHEKKFLITADSVGIIYPYLNIMIPTTPPPSFDANLSIFTVKKLKNLEPNLLLIPHFGIRKDPEFVFDMTVKKIKQWVEDVKKIKNEDFNKIYNEILKNVLNETKKEIPDYAKETIKVSILGILKYLTI